MQLHHQLMSTIREAITASNTLSPFAARMMAAEERRLTLKNIRLIAFLAATLVPFFGVLDYFYYPEHLTTFLLLRAACTVAGLIVLGVTFTRWGKRHYRLFTVTVPLIPAVFIAMMIVVSKDPASAYYAGLTLVIVATGFVFHWTFREAIVVVVVTVALYFAACVPSMFAGFDTRAAAGFVNNTIFLAAEGVVIISGCLAHHRIRVNEFTVRANLRTEKIRLRRQRDELERTLNELEETEGQLIQSEKMASLGQLCAGVIHEIGNPLNYSNQALFLLKKDLRKLETPERVDEAVADIQESLDRIKDIVSDLREFSHKTGETSHSFAIAEPVAMAARVLGKELEDRQVGLKIDVPESIQIEGAKNQITQVLVNLIQNAAQALSDVDRLERLIEVTAREERGEIELNVIDNGPGIAAEVISQIFDPFYTTKEVGVGTGLGLSICFRIIEAHSGTIHVESEEDKYTRFELRFPAAVAEPRPAIETLPALAQEPSK